MPDRTWIAYPTTDHRILVACSACHTRIGTYHRVDVPAMDRAYTDHHCQEDPCGD